MLKRNITYEDFNGDQVTDIFYFNLSEPELIEMDVEHQEGLKVLIEKIIATNDNKELIKMFKDLVLRAHGIKSDDGKRFIKSDQLREEFSQTAAYSALFMELATKDDAAVDFLKGILPRNMQADIDKAMATPTPIKPNG